ncbi:hypothetical protein CLOP_g14317 [Closterium sp. NIES-67]|nr:hypothetical protein CLOP_g14317 [Closterium sp. NIES-67]
MASPVSSLSDAYCESALASSPRRRLLPSIWESRRFFGWMTRDTPSVLLLLPDGGVRLYPNAVTAAALRREFPGYDVRCAMTLHLVTSAAPLEPGRTYSLVEHRCTAHCRHCCASAAAADHHLRAPPSPFRPCSPATPGSASLTLPASGPLRPASFPPSAAPHSAGAVFNGQRSRSATFIRGTERPAYSPSPRGPALSSGWSDAQSGAEQTSAQGSRLRAMAGTDTSFWEAEVERRPQMMRPHERTSGQSMARARPAHGLGHAEAEGQVGETGSWDSARQGAREAVEGGASMRIAARGSTAGSAQDHAAGQRGAAAAAWQGYYRALQRSRSMRHDSRADSMQSCSSAGSSSAASGTGRMSGSSSSSSRVSSSSSGMWVGSAVGRSSSSRLGPISACCS